MSNINKEEIARLRNAVEQASELPWFWSNGKRDLQPGDYVHQGAHLGETLIALDDTYEGSTEDCALVVLAVNSLPCLLDALDQKDALLAECREVLEWYGDIPNQWQVDPFHPDDPPAIARDQGWRARALLEKMGEVKGV